ncbi:CD63 antigen-like [Malaya genurostris]|uniref:CD63 antigen-like n=1 Tax=Malaya genurostris TaxID=325434 RepID=UPI0026F39A2C|nr:CD63 antigen-like [Malaya genurostris]XP_058450551.1 CD63 antigen-like [Malaya genurostris]XP_058450552.1 CD63 antigen-like [Malaya genurostris]
MSLSTSANLVKYLLFLFNFLFVITGISIMAVGLTVQGAYHNFSDILDPQFFSVPTFLVVIGCFIFIIAFFGCCGAYKENYCMTLTFSILLVLIFILELAAGISGYVLRNDTYNMVSKTLRNSMTQYGGNSSHEITILWDEIQVDFDCCGVDSSDDWIKSNDKLFNATTLPMTCCRTAVGTIGYIKCPDSEFPDRMRKDGCVKSFGNYIRSHAVSLGSAGIAIAVIQFFGIFFACYLSKQIKMQHGHSGF